MELRCVCQRDYWGAPALVQMTVAQRPAHRHTDSFAQASGPAMSARLWAFPVTVIPTSGVSMPESQRTAK